MFTALVCSQQPEPRVCTSAQMASLEHQVATMQADLDSIKADNAQILADMQVLLKHYGYHPPPTAPPPSPPASPPPPPSPPPPSIPPSPPYPPLSPFAQRLVFKSSPQRTWSAAKEDCEAGGGRLAEVTSAEENAAVVAAASGASGFWIGATDAAEEGTWLWAWSGRPLSYHTYSNWAPGEPNDAYAAVVETSEDCLQVFGDAHDVLEHQGAWNDARCTLNEPYVCEQLW